MGWGRDGLIRVRTDARYRLDPADLPRALDLARERGRRVIAVVASACSTATGSFDPLNPIADFCEQHGLWLHVDGAHGEAAALSPSYRHLIQGIERADSVVWDAHKMLLMPALATAVLFRNGRDSYQAFAQHASYLFSEAAPEEQWFNLCQRTLECTKHMMALHLYTALCVYGTNLFADYITQCFDLGQQFGEMLEQQPDFHVATAPDCNIVCFRYRPDATLSDTATVDALQEKIRRSLLQSGDFYLVQTRLPTGLFLRVTLINPFTTQADLHALLAAIRQAGRTA